MKVEKPASQTRETTLVIPAFVAVPDRDRREILDSKDTVYLEYSIYTSLADFNTQEQRWMVRARFIDQGTRAAALEQRKRDHGRDELQTEYAGACEASRLTGSNHLFANISSPLGLPDWIL